MLLAPLWYNDHVVRLFIPSMSDDVAQKMAFIVQSVAAKRYRYTIHGEQQRIARRLRRQEIEEVLLGGEIIEDYPQHHYGPACLVFGKTKQGKAVHVLCGLHPLVSIITVYEPDTIDWEEDLKTRRNV